MGDVEDCVILLLRAHVTLCARLGNTSAIGNELSSCLCWPFWLFVSQGSWCVGCVKRVLNPGGTGHTSLIWGAALVLESAGSIFGSDAAAFGVPFEALRLAARAVSRAAFAQLEQRKVTLSTKVSFTALPLHRRSPQAVQRSMGGGGGILAAGGNPIGGLASLMKLFISSCTELDIGMVLLVGVAKAGIAAGEGAAVGPQCSVIIPNS